MLHLLSVVAALAATVTAHDDHNQDPIAGPHKSLWYNTLPGDGGTQVQTTSSHTQSIRITTLTR